MQFGLLTPPAIPGVSIINSTADVLHNMTGLHYESSVDVCAFETYLTHGDAGDEVRVVVWLPLGENTSTPWNGHFLGTGGGGFLTGYFDSALGPAVAQGYAAVSTVAVVGRWEGSSDGWGQDHQLRLNLAYRSVHEMTTIGKAVAYDFYGSEATYSYFAGCSMGGRQAHTLAQRYPADYDGILAASAAISWAEVAVQTMWPYVMQSSQEGFVGFCKLDALTKASIAACDETAVGFIAYPPDCDFQVQSLVGTTVNCGNGTGSIVTEHDASIWELARKGPRDVDGKFL